MSETRSTPEEIASVLGSKIWHEYSFEEVDYKRVNAIIEEAILSERTEVDKLRDELAGMKKETAPGLRALLADKEKETTTLRSELRRCGRVLKDVRPYVQNVWYETKGTDREGTAMSAAFNLQKIDGVLASPILKAVMEEK